MRNNRNKKFNSIFNSKSQKQYKFKLQVSLNLRNSLKSQFIIKKKINPKKNRLMRSNRSKKFNSSFNSKPHKQYKLQLQVFLNLRSSLKSNLLKWRKVFSSLSK